MKKKYYNLINMNMNTNNNTEDARHASDKKREESGHSECIMLWNNDETNWDSVKRFTQEGKIIDEPVNIDLTAYYENVVSIAR